VMSSQTSYSAEYTNFIDMFDKLGDSYDAYDDIYITVSFEDAAGNLQEQSIPYEKGTMLGVTFSATENTPFKPDDSDIVTITGTKGDADAVWVKVGTGSYKAATISGSGWNCTFSKSEFPAGSGTYTFYAKGMNSATYETEIIRCKYIVDVQSPTVEITDITAENGEGYVSQSGNTWTAAGKIRISGIYNDDLADSLANVSAASLKIKIGSTTKNITNVTRNYNGTAWEWYYIWDTEVTSGSFLSSVVTSSAQTITVSAVDIASNSSTDSSKKIQLKPIVTGASGDIYPIRQLNDYVLDTDPAVLKYSVAQGSSVTLHGYNPMQDPDEPIVKCGSQSVTVTSSSLHEISFTVGTWTSASVTITVNSVASDNVWFSIWKISSLTSSSRDYDTLDAEGYDAYLLSDNKVFVTFARNHKISGVTEYNERDYGAYSYKEGANQAYRISKIEDRRTNNGVVDPVFYASVAQISDNYFVGMFTYDEFGNSEIYTRCVGFNTSNALVSDYYVYDNLGEQNTFTAVKNVHNGKNYLYTAGYNSDGRSSNPIPQIYFISYPVHKIDPVSTKISDNCDGYFDLISTSNT
ncbi:MAG: hypothetical protein J6W76_02055, partial [Spirochaetales bacterium]|nr:hypothetical protein [Spirochaetales bacterium]